MRACLRRTLQQQSMRDYVSWTSLHCSSGRRGATYVYNLGHTRSVRRSSHLIHTPDTFIRTQIPGCSKASVIVHVSPGLGANFTQYSVEFEAGGSLGTASGQRFLYVLDGTVTLEYGAETYTLVENEYAYIPQGEGH